MEEMKRINRDMMGQWYGEPNEHRADQMVDRPDEDPDEDDEEDEISDIDEAEFPIKFIAKTTAITRAGTTKIQIASNAG